MNNLIGGLLDKSRAVILVFLLILIAGAGLLSSIPKEANPDVPIPYIYVSLVHEGISPEDAERMLIRPMENELRSLEGIKKMTSRASEGSASVTLEFYPEVDAEKALADVRDAVTLAKAKLPSESEEPSIHEITMAEQNPAISVILSGTVPEYTIAALSRNLRDQLESLTEVLEVKINGAREDMLEVVVNPQIMESYNITPQELFSLVGNNNKLVAAGTLDTGSGRFAVKIPGLVKDLQDMLSMPVKVVGEKVVTFSDIATIRRTYKDARSFARLDGDKAITLQIIKRPGENTIGTVDKVKEIVKTNFDQWPSGITVNFTGDSSKDVKSMLGDLGNNVLSAILLVSIVIIAVLGLRSAALVSLSIPGAFLAGITVLATFGVTLNNVVLFALIMAVGMLVDGAIVVIEYADRKMSEGVPKKYAYLEASQRMSWPIIASTATTLAAFAPLLFWPDIMGEFMKYLPMTLIAVLGASLLMALVFVPTLGSVFGKPRYISEATKKNLLEAEDGDLDKVTGFTGRYIKMLRVATGRPVLVLFISIGVLLSALVGYGIFGHGVEFFPNTEPSGTSVLVKARGDLSIDEKNILVKQVEERLLDLTDDVSTFVTRGGGEDVIGRVKLNFKEWDQRKKAAEIYKMITERTKDISGIQVTIRQQQNGPGGGRAFDLELSSKIPALVDETIEKVQQKMMEIGGFVDIDDDRSLAGIEWRLQVDREKAARFGASVQAVGNVVQLVTNGIKVAEYRPDDADEEVDIRIRYPIDTRNIEQLDNLRIATNQGLIPVGNFVKRIAAQKVDTIRRIEGKRANRITADMAPGENFAQKLQELQAAIPEMNIDPRVSFNFRGQNEQQQNSQAFLKNAFMIALAVIFIILVAQFNSLYQSFLILSAILFSTTGVFIGLLIMNQPFGIVMSGIGVISLAGIVVNNNIVLIDTYNHLRKQGMPVQEAILRTGAQRLRPVLLTTVTTILGLMPMVLQVNIDILSRDVSYGAPSTEWWVQLSSAVAGGLAFSTLLTLIVTPSMLMIGHRTSKFFNRLLSNRKAVTAQKASVSQ
ncbi:efflux RND transporter permease subunit [Aliikangiella coralliicola]|uniref:Efflux RND transporter permease subunit n=1 Tax=Aliikangiella coralliicola TaxID=2592383 RepID=A0A545UDX8_9GAMM|nr:efflux RND transporter permease subunit [Aliikangiella coralliicola]TQV87633.1 efflux RND transporter permease subunit [Aliikangiella coralliicola]